MLSSWKHRLSQRACLLFLRSNSSSTNSSCSSRNLNRPEAVYSKKDLTYFGDEVVSEEQKRDRVEDVFTNVASKYDLMNDLMSFGIHRLWKTKFVSKLNPPSGSNIIDVAGGTGDIAFRIINRGVGSRVVVCDINKSMLDVGENNARAYGYKNSEVEFVEGDAQSLKFEDESFDAYTIAFGIRNVVRIDDALKEAYRILKPGGRFVCLEFSSVTNPILQNLYYTYLFDVIPVMGTVVTGDYDSYRYFAESIRKFPSQEDFKEIIENSGFRFVRYDNLSCGIVAIHSGYKI